MIKIKKFNGLKPAPAYTDFTAVYVSNSLSASEEKTALKHERAHIFLQHNCRMKKLENKILANIAGDLEIAYHIYNDEDDLSITLPRSLLAGGIRKKDCDKYPDCIYMEDFYKKLLEEKESNLKSHDAAANILNDSEGELSEDVESIVNKAIKQINDSIDADEIEKKQQEVQAIINNFKSPKPSLASELLSVFGRNKLKHKRSYRNPDEFENNNDFFKKGWITEKRKPKLNIFVDRSGSFDESKTVLATKKLDECLMKYRGRISRDVFYFNHMLMGIDPKVGHGGTDYKQVIDKINTDAADLSIIITDNDPCNSELGPKAKTIVMPIGCSTTSVGAKFNLVEVYE